MHPIYEFTLPALVWTLVLWRAPAAIGGARPSRCLWGFLVAVAVALTTRPPAVEHLIRISTGSPDLSVLVKHFACLASFHFMLEYVISVYGRRPQRAAAVRLRVAVVSAAALALTVLFVFFFEHDPGVPATAVTDDHLGDPAVRLYEGVVYAYFGTATLLSAKLFWSNRHAVPAGLLRAGVVCLAGGCALGLVYTVYRVVFLARQQSRTHGTQEGFGDPVSEFLPAVILLVLAVGLALPPLKTLVRYVHDQYALWRLYPLWSDLVRAVPAVAFGPRVGRTRDLLTLGDRTLDVAHRAFEIRDACLVLRDRCGATRPEGAGTGSGTLTPRGGAGAGEEAAWLTAALHGAPGSHHAPLPSDARTPGEEIAWLLEVAAAYRKSSRGRGAVKGLSEDPSMEAAS
ncbi:MAB_1171c family putative transporter [Streptomyces sp. NPDC096339]|uniref:MAB_1171c family putative transporter n=1 Tax=Streptomyces sp. NPDC096339 TaxID=3366086 RepID=UPI003812A743